MTDKLLLTILDKFSAASIAELDLDDGTSHLVLKKESAFRCTGSGEHTASSDAGKERRQAGDPLPAKGEGEKISSPIVATFYASPGPDSPPFVTSGSRVKAGETLCILEAMKMMNHLEAEFDCEIIRAHAASGDLVEYGQALFTVKRL